MRIRWKSMIIALAAWHVICLGVIVVYPHTIGRLFLALYAACLGDIQASYGRFERVAVYLGLATVTSIATACVFPIFDWLSKQRTTLRSKVICTAGTQVPLLLILIWSYESGFPYKLNQLGWTVFGPPADIYSFRNLALPRLIAWQMSTTPIVLIGLWLHGKLGKPRGDRPSPVAGQNVRADP